jgi:hypothetical protein
MGISRRASCRAGGFSGPRCQSSRAKDTHDALDEVAGSGFIGLSQSTGPFRSLRQCSLDMGEDGRRMKRYGF